MLQAFTPPSIALLAVLAQTPGGLPPSQDPSGASVGPPAPAFPPPFGPGMGRPGGMGREPLKVVARFDGDGNGRLDGAERKAARAFLAEERTKRGPGRRPPFPRPPGPVPGAPSPPQPGPRVSPADVSSFPDRPLYDPATVRTLFLTFEAPDWEKELSDFRDTDVEVPATLLVDGKTYEEVGVRFRGASSLMMVGEGRKRSLNLSIDHGRADQRLAGYRTLNLLNAHTDPTFLRTVLYHEAARRFLPAPRANLVRVVINGESWGVYVNAQQFNKDFTREFFGSEKGARWKVPGRPRGDGGLAYLGEDVAEYRRRYEIKSKDDPASWAALIALCRVLEQTPPAKLEKALAPILDIDGVFAFLALENVLINGDGYWIRASDYHLYRDEKGRFHVVPHDANETFRAPEGPGMGPPGMGPPGWGPSKGVDLDPFAGADDPRKPLLSKLLAVPALRQRYLGLVRAIATDVLDWKTLGPTAQRYQALIAGHVAADTRKLSTTEAFTKAVSEDVEEPGFRGPHRIMGLKTFAEQRRAFLLAHPEVKKARLPARTRFTRPRPGA